MYFLSFFCPHHYLTLVLSLSLSLSFFSFYLSVSLSLFSIKLITLTQSLSSNFFFYLFLFSFYTSISSLSLSFSLLSAEFINFIIRTWNHLHKSPPPSPSLSSSSVIRVFRHAVINASPLLWPSLINDSTLHWQWLNMWNLFESTVDR